MNELDLFAAAIAIDNPRDRDALLERECAGRPELRLRLDRLLEAHFRPEPWLDRPGLDETRDLSIPENIVREEPVRDERAGAVIAGKYTLVEVVGEGGMGSVWRARQTVPVKRFVAVKLIKAGMDSRQVLARFDAERQALALMDHPNIAKVLDGGLHEGRPYFVMELVKGVPITEFCDARRLTPRERLELFVPVCQAIQHAHQKGIIHRDIKPSNVLIALYDDKPVAKVIDFGVAKATGGALTEHTIDTGFGGVVGTPQYMSPEQATFNNLDVDTRSDIYALGILLYELLTGSPPFSKQDLEKRGVLEMLRVVREEEPPRPSTKLSTADALPSLSASRSTEPGRLTGLLRNELDWVVMKALEKDRSRRYETANGFAADVQRYLNGDAVHAHPPSASYRLRKFVRRNRGQVLAASLVLLSLLGGLAAVAAVQTAANARLAASLTRETNANTALNEANGQLTKSRVAVEARYDLAMEAIKTFHTGVSEDFLLKEDKFKALRDRLLNSASDFYARLAAMLKDAKDLPSRRALSQSSYEVAELMTKVGRREDALALHRRVLAGREALAAEAGAGLAARVDLATSLAAVGLALQSLGKTDEALKSFEQARATVSAGDGGPPPDAAARSAYADAEYNMGRVLIDIGRKAEALHALERARDVQKALADESPYDRELLASLARIHYNICFLQSQTGKPDEALASVRSMLEIRKGLAAANPAVTEFRFDLARSHNMIGALLFATGKPDAALESIRSALEIQKGLAEANPAVTRFQCDLALSYDNIGTVLGAMGKPVEAMVSYRSGLEIRKRLAEANPAVTDFQSQLSNSHANIGQFLGKTGKPDEALVSLRSALEIQRMLAEAGPTVTEFRTSLIRTHNLIGNLLKETGKPAEALTSYRSAVEIARGLAEANPAVTDFQSDLAGSHLNIGSLLSEMGNSAEALASNRSALEIWKGLAKANPTITDFQDYLAASHNNIGSLLLATGTPVEALASYRLALEIRKGLAEANPTYLNNRQSLASSHTYAADALRQLGQRGEARVGYEAAIALREVLVRDDPATPAYRSDLAYSTRRLGLTRLADGDAPGAAADTRRALGLLDGLPTRKPSDWFETACNHATLSALAGREGSGVPESDRAKEAEQAIELLKKAVGMGYRNPGIYRLETALDPLRERVDFKKLIEELETKSPAKTEEKP